MRFEKVIIFLMVLSIFLDDFIVGYTNNAARAASSFDFYYYYLIFLTFLFFYLVKVRKVPWLPGWFLTPLLLLFTASFITGLVLDNLKYSMAKQIIGITFSATAYYNLIRFVKYDINRLFHIYLKISLFVAAYGIVEEILLLRGYHYLFDNAKRVSLGFYRVYSIMGEPYFLSVALIPALYYYLHALMFRKLKVTENYLWLKLGTIAACYFFTFSSAGIIALGIMIGLLLYNMGYFNPTNPRFIGLVLLFFIISISSKDGFFSIAEFQIRMEDSYKAFATGKPLDKKDVAELNSSTFALYSNYIIAQQSFAANPFTGSGLGSHEYTYDEFFGKIFGKKFMIMYGNFNQKDGNSLFIRLMSETGLLGLFLIFIFTFKFLIGRRQITNAELLPYVIINQSIFIVIVIRLLRTGNYIGQGFFFFLFLYYFTYLLVKNRQLHPKSTVA